ncbi:MAG: hypothetical protein QNJ74_29755 [Trichodesmium sp. MO_231.B1]|nr:hypothetical protein [Trichodesmium sp. MO_231.B1]
MIYSQQIQAEHSHNRRGFAPSLTDAEVITMEIVGEFQGIDTDQGIWEYFKPHWFSLFPDIKSRTTYLPKAANLWMYKQELPKFLAWELGACSDSIRE